METIDVPGEVREFLLKYIASVAQLEALLLIWSRPDKCWRLSEIAARIYASKGETAKALNALAADGLVVCTNGVFRLSAPAEKIEMIRKLQEVYARYLIPVTNVIHSKSGNPPGK
jgi:predicted transcriptional regulator